MAADACVQEPRKEWGQKPEGCIRSRAITVAKRTVQRAGNSSPSPASEVRQRKILSLAILEPGAIRVKQTESPRPCPGGSGLTLQAAHSLGARVHPQTTGTESLFLFPSPILFCK